MNQTDTPASKPFRSLNTLGYLGLVPFVLPLILHYYGSYSAVSEQAFIFYSAIILSFLSGTFWSSQAANHYKHQIISNVFCLIAFVALFLDVKVAIGVLIIGYTVLLFYEIAALEPKREKDYLKVRTILTSSVVLLHILAFLTW